MKYIRVYHMYCITVETNIYRGNFSDTSNKLKIRNLNTVGCESKIIVLHQTVSSIS